MIGENIIEDLENKFPDGFMLSVFDSKRCRVISLIRNPYSLPVLADISVHTQACIAFHSKFVSIDKELIKDDE